MLSELDFDKKDFLKQGAVFGKNNEIWLLWGDPHEVQSRPEAIAISQAQFLSEENPHWLLFPYAIQLNWDEARELFRTCHVDRQFQEASRQNFEEQFGIIQEGFKSKAVEKVVPYVFETSNSTLDTDELENCLHSVLKQTKGFVYGSWRNGEGFLGLTPEILIRQKSPDHFETMALAGTRSLDDYSINPEQFISDPKEKKEHIKVVEDIVTQLENMGRIELSEMEVETTPHLAHLLTRINFKRHSNVQLEDLVQRLHPTPALGCYPRKKLREYMKKFDELEPRGVFGAPFGISYSQRSADFVVAIRNIIWNEDEVKVGSGCGVVAESDLDKEWQELENKRNSVKKIFGFLDC